MPELDTGEGRGLLLQYLPDILRNQTSRNTAKVVDLANIVDACMWWEPDSASGDPHPLGLLVATAHLYAKGLQRAQLEALIDTLPPGFVPDTPRLRCPYPGMVP